MGMIQASRDIGGHYASYAPGHGGICFVHLNEQGRATNEAIPEDVARALTPDGWTLTKPLGRWEAVRKIERVTASTLNMEDATYRHKITPLGHEFWLWNGNEWETVRNESRRASLRHFLEMEGLYVV